MKCSVVKPPLLVLLVLSHNLHSGEKQLRNICLNGPLCQLVFHAFTYGLLNLFICCTCETKPPICVTSMFFRRLFGCTLSIFLITQPNTRSHSSVEIVIPKGCLDPSLCTLSITVLADALTKSRAESAATAIALD